MVSLIPFRCAQNAAELPFSQLNSPLALDDNTPSRQLCILPWCRRWSVNDCPSLIWGGGTFDLSLICQCWLFNFYLFTFARLPEINHKTSHFVHATGTRIIYDRKFLLDCRNSPLARTPPCCLPQIPGVTVPATHPIGKLQDLKEEAEEEEKDVAGIRTIYCLCSRFVKSNAYTWISVWTI